MTTIRHSTTWSDQEKNQFRSLRDYLQRGLHQDPLFAPHADFIFEKIDKLGEGGMGIVYRVKDRRLEREAAMKVLIPDQVGPRSTERFLREAQITARLNHPCIPAIFESGKTADEQLYMLMQVIQGETLTARIRAYHDAGRPPEAFKDLLEQLIKVSDALHYAHSRGVLHRDIKPDNIMIGQFGEVMVMDWGIARDLHDSIDHPLQGPQGTHVDSANPMQLTQEGAAIGTPGYMSPEQAGGDVVNEKTDIFALGGLLMEILTDTQPVEGKNTIAIITSTVSGTYTSALKRDSSVPRELNSLTMKAMAYEPEKRYPSAKAFGQDLRNFLTGAPVSAHSYGAMERTQRWVKHHPKSMLGLFAFLFALGLGALLWSLWSQQEQERKRAENVAAQAKESQERVERLFRNLTEAQSLANRGQSLEEIQKTLAPVLEDAGGALPVYLSVARVYEDAGYFDPCKDVLERAIKAHPPAYEALFYLHELELKESKKSGHSFFTDAFNRIQKVAKDRGDVNEFTLFGDALRAEQENDLKRALELYNKVEEANSRFAPLYNNRGYVKQRLGDKKGAMADYERCTALAPNDYKAHFNAGLLLMNAARFSKAIDEFDLCLKKQPNYFEAYINRASCHSRLGNQRAALTDYKSAHMLRRNDTKALMNLGVTYSALGEHNKGIQFILRAREINPKQLSIYRNLGLIYDRAGDRKKSMQYLNRLVNEKPSADNYFTRGYVRGSYDPEGAFEDYTLAVQADSSYVKAWVNRGRIYKSRGQIDKAIQDFQSALEANPKFYMAHYNLALTYYKLQDYKKMLPPIQATLRYNPEYSGAHLYEGLAHYNLGDYAAAIQSFNKAIQFNPKYVVAYHNRARAYSKLGQYSKAINDSSSAVTLDSNFILSRIQRAGDYLRTGQKQKALKDYQAALQLKPSTAQERDIRGAIQRLLK